jgi:hypothetical protein
MALFRRLFYRKPPDRLLEIAERVYGNPVPPPTSLACNAASEFGIGVQLQNCRFCSISHYKSGGMQIVAIVEFVIRIIGNLGHAIVGGAFL